MMLYSVLYSNSVSVALCEAGAWLFYDAIYLFTLHRGLAVASDSTLASFHVAIKPTNVLCGT